MELLQWGANRRFETTSGEWWRLLASMFFCSGIMHLFLNISGLVQPFCRTITRTEKLFYFVYFIWTLWKPCKYLVVSNSISVGASGAIFGLYGAILGLLLTNAFRRRKKKEY
jgi:rhomboid protease GluP